MPLDQSYVAWSKFSAEYGNVVTGNNRFAVTPWFGQLRAMGVDILANITASPSRFPLASATDYANMWELWQHYYAQAFLLSRDHAVADALGGPYVDVDTPKDEYRPALTFGSLGTFTAQAQFATSGTKFIRFRVTGRTAPSTNVNLDKITLRS